MCFGCANASPVRDLSPSGDPVLTGDPFLVDGGVVSAKDICEIVVCVLRVDNGSEVMGGVIEVMSNPDSVARLFAIVRK